MSKQFRVYLLPSDTERLIAELRVRIGLKIVEQSALGPNPIELESPIRKESAYFRTRGSVSARCYLVPNDADLRFSYYPKQNIWHIQDSSEVIEFSGCDCDGSILLIGRFYFQNDMLLDDTIWPKRQEFTDWADRVFRTAKRLLRRSKTLDAYIGKDADQFRQNGGRFASFMKADGEPIYADA